ncbi:hypothetical protein [Campylobacter sp. MIT 97-5078]|uniref:hypothetical protein n=1 Tax=Campylobacter sp. MIT 97-5078 TaxID=1548153 RepID=UPI0006913CCD|nr:hypothetical protein [Campylobacter sp. MIT 97-5078]TQR27424.1 hypothetical protein DMB91_03985 [Campylobacter sp. MIT 97-5078]
MTGTNNTSSSRPSTGGIGNKGDVNQYGSGKFAHPNLDFGEAKEREWLGGRNILNALSEIQRYHIIEERSEEIPKEYFTLEQIWDYLKIGFKNGMLESFIFSCLLCFLQVIYPSYKYYFQNEPITQTEQLFFSLSSYAPIVITTLFMVYISKYYKGLLTRRAIFALMNGRSASFLLKGIAIFLLFSWIMKISLENPKLVYSWADWTMWIFEPFISGISVKQVYIFYYKYAIPSLHDAGYEILFSMCIFAFLPYITIFYKGYKERRDKQIIQDEYQNY